MNAKSTTHSDGLDTAENPESCDKADKSRRIEAFCEIGATLFGATRQDLHAIRIALSAERRDAGAGSASAPESSRVPATQDALEPCATRLLEAARTLDDVLEFSPNCEMSIGGLLVEAEKEIGPNGSRLLKQLRHQGCEPGSILACIPQLPVYPSIASRVISVASKPEPAFEELIDCAVSDSVLAGAVISEAQTMGYTKSQPVRSVAQAIGRIGAVRAACVMISATVKPMIQRVGNMRNLWLHSLEAARLSSALSSEVQIASSIDGYVLGLLHDIGGLLLRLAPRAAASLCEKLQASGCPLLIAESLAFGLNHAEAGQHVLTYWGFLPDIAESVRCHHEPDLSDSPLASVLYLVEHRTTPPEDLPSQSRLEAALRRLSMTAEQFEVIAGGLKTERLVSVVA